MKIKYVFETKDLSSMAGELEPIVALIKDNCVNYDGVDITKLRWENGRAVIDVLATLSPKQINTALERGGYEGHDVVGINNDTGKVLFNDEINDMYIIGSVFLEFKDGCIQADHGTARDEDCFSTFEGF